jgi:hypothetical protein
MGDNTGRYRAVAGRPRWRRSSAPSVVPAPRLPAGIDLVDVVTKLAHKVSPDEMVTGHQRGDYLGFCGERFRAACLVEPGRGPCQLCRERATS